MSNTAVVITAVDETRAAFASVNAGIESMGAAAGAVTSMLSGLLAGVGLAGFAHMVRGTIEATANLNDMAAAAGTTVEKMSALNEIAKIGGRDVGGFEQGMARLSKVLATVDDESKTATRALNAIGVDAQALKAMDPADALLTVAQALDKYGDGAGKTAAVQDILGRGAQKLIPALRDLAEKGELVGSVTAQQSEEAERLEKALNAIKVEGGKTFQQMVANWTPAMLEIATAMRDAAKDGGTLKAVFVGFGGVMENAFAGPWRATLKGVGAEFQEMVASIEERWAKVTFGGVSEMHMRRALQARERAKAIYNEIAAMGSPRGQEPQNPDKPRLNYDASKPAATGKTARDSFADLMNESAGVSKNFQRDLQTLFEGYRAGRTGLDDYRGAVERLIAKQPFATKMAKDEAETRKEQAKVYEKISAAEDQMAKSGAVFDAATAQRLEGIREQMDAIGASPEQIERVKAFAGVNKDLARELAHLESVMGKVGMGGTEDYDRAIAEATAKATKAKDDIAAALADKRAALDAWNADAMNGANKALDDYLRAVQNVAASTEQMVSRAFKGMEDALVNFVMKGKLDFKGLADSIVADLIRIQIRQSITGPLAESMKSGGGLLGGIKSLFGFASGGVMSGAGISAYSGSVVSRPTLFPFANGIGLMGEAGAEAILPLKRGSDGKLGVASGGSSVTVNIIEDSSRAGQTQSRQEQGGASVLDVFVDRIRSAVATDIARGSGPIPAALAGTYGLNRAAGGY